MFAVTSGGAARRMYRRAATNDQHPQDDRGRRNEPGQESGPGHGRVGEVLLTVTGEHPIDELVGGPAFPCHRLHTVPEQRPRVGSADLEHLTGAIRGLEPGNRLVGRRMGFEGAA